MKTTLYDEIPYPSLVYTDTHPGRLATLAAFFGLTPPAIATSRILELGCGDGTNLIAIAQTLPQAECWGIDLSTKQITMGQRIVQAVPLSNVTLRTLDFNEIDESLGQFDYVIAHGVYSWVSLEMQETVLNLIQRHLAPSGIAYVSYNLYPGWHMENLAREMMMYHVQQLPAVPFHILMMQAKGILQFIAHLRQQGQETFDIFLQEKAQQLQQFSDNYLYHDFLEQENHPVYFREFVHHIQQYRLAYITDIEFRHYLMRSFPTEVIEAMEELFQGDWFKKEQYMDFFYNRTLRRSLLCHQNLSINRQLDWKVILDSYITAYLSTDNGTEFKKSDGEVITVEQPFIKQALQLLSQIYPSRILFNELFQQMSPPEQPNSQTLRDDFAQQLFDLYCHEAIEINIDPPIFITQIKTYPTASPLARWQATQEQQETFINLRCELVKLDPVAVALLPYLNGKNDKAALTKILKKLIKNREIEQFNRPIKKMNLAAIVDKVLSEMAQHGFLMFGQKW